MYSLKYSRQADRYLATLQKQTVLRVKAKVGLLKKNPLPKGVIKLKGFEGNLFRVRIGNYRVIYEIYPPNQLIHVSKIDKRSRAY